VLNMQFYMFLAGRWGKLFALSAIPFHLLYFASSGLAFSIAFVRYQYRKLINSRPVPVVGSLPNEDNKAAAVRSTLPRPSIRSHIES
jgi:hypothetical protein